MHAIYVPLSEPVRQALNELAEREYRDPRDQAAKLLSEALRASAPTDHPDSDLTTTAAGSRR